MIYEMFNMSDFEASSLIWFGFSSLISTVTYGEASDTCRLDDSA